MLKLSKYTVIYVVNNIKQSLITRVVNNPIDAQKAAKEIIEKYYQNQEYTITEIHQLENSTDRTQEST